MTTIFLALVMAAPPVAGDPAAAEPNRTSIESARGRVELPPGVVYLDQALTLTSKHAGMVFEGKGTTLQSTQKWGGYIERGALGVRNTDAYSFYEPRPTVTRLPAGQVGWLFNESGNGWFYQGPVQRILPGEPIPAWGPKDVRAFMRGHRAAPFAPIGAGATQLQFPGGHPFGIGETLLLTDGPLINELRVEYRKVTATTTTSIELDVKTVKQYVQPAAVGGDWPRDITFKGIAFAGDMGPAFLGPAVDLRFEDCTFAKNDMFPGHAGWLTISGCARLSFVRCKIDCGMTITSSHDIHFRDCTLPLLICEQGVRRVTFDGGTVTPGHYFDARVQTTDCTIRGVTFDRVGGISFYDGWHVSDCRILGAETAVNVRGGRCVVQNLDSDAPVLVQANYQGSPVGSGKNVTLRNIKAPSLHCETGTSGTITGTTCPITGDLRGWSITRP